MGKRSKPPRLDGPHWFALQAAFDLRRQSVGEISLAISDLTRDMANGKLCVMRIHLATGKREYVEPPFWIDHAMFSDLGLFMILPRTPPRTVTGALQLPRFHERDTQHAYYIWKPHFDAVYGDASGARDHDDAPRLAIDRATAVLRDLYPTKAQMPEQTLKATTKAVADKCSKRGWEPPHPDTVARALVELGYRAPRKGR